MIAGQPWRGSTSIRSIRGSAPGVGRDATDAASAAAARAAEAAAADVLGDVRGHDAVPARDPGAGDVAAGVAAVVPEERARAHAAVDAVVAVAVLDDPVAAVDAVSGVVAAARREGEREHGDGHEGHVARAVATAFAHSAFSLFSVWMRRSVSTTS